MILYIILFLSANGVIIAVKIGAGLSKLFNIKIFNKLNEYFEKRKKSLGNL